MAISRLAPINNIFDEDYDLDRLRKLIIANNIIGKEVWSKAGYLRIFTTKPVNIERATIHYVSLLKNGNILCHTKTCAFPVEELGRKVFFRKEDAIKNLR